MDPQQTEQVTPPVTPPVQLQPRKYGKLLRIIVILLLLAVTGFALFYGSVYFTLNKQLDRINQGPPIQTTPPEAARSSSPPLDIPLPTIEVYCTLEAKVCPDGSTVSRVGPNCDFAPCPQ